MLDLYEELKTVITLLNSNNIKYALIGGLAVSIYTKPRFTEDIDFLILSDEYENCSKLLSTAGYECLSQPMSFSKGTTEIRRLTKLEKGGPDYIIVDIMLASDNRLKKILSRRKKIRLENQNFWIVEKNDLKGLKRKRGSKQDILDIENLDNT